MDARSLLKPAVFVACGIPFARLVALGAGGGLGANPVEFVTRSTGTWTLVLLCVTLALTPARRMTGWNALARVRRMVGLYAFFYACLHFATYVWLDQWFDAGAMLRDVVKRPFITAGFTAFVLLLPLAATSTHAMMRRLGRRWGELHRLVYAVAILGVLHFAWHKAGKNLLAEPMIYAAVVGALLAWRVWWHWRAAGRAKVFVGHPRSSA
ncbi:MAG: protein-methionine-sulfoxide reductase heme-binding subunit MsrQ [Burkholderiaceae bacterium]